MKRIVHTFFRSVLKGAATLRQQRRTLVLLWLSCLFGSRCGLANAQATYSVASLGAPGGISSRATALSSNGRVVGSIDTGNYYTAFLWTPADGSRILDGSDSTSAWVNVYGVNASSDVVGSSSRGGLGTTDAVYWLRGGRQSKLLSNGRTLGINDVGQMVGGMASSTGWKMFLSQMVNGRRKTFDLGSGLACAISPSGKIAGTENNSVAGFLWTPTSPNGTTGSRVTFSIGADITEVAGLNESGQVVGTAGYPRRAFLWQGGVVTMLGTLPGLAGYEDYLESRANGINAAGTVVGSAAFVNLGSNNEPQLYSHAFRWQPGEGLRDLNDLITSSPGWVITEAVAINDAGQIAASGLYNGTGPFAVLLTPQN